jgi:hypothetical protein
MAQASGHIPCNLNSVLRRELLLPVEPIPEGFSLHVRHDVIKEVASFTGVMERQDVGMVEPGGDFDLVQKAARTDGMAQFRLQDLEGYLPPMPQVLGEVDDRHAAATKFSLDAVALT